MPRLSLYTRCFHCYAERERSISLLLIANSAYDELSVREWNSVQHDMESRRIAIDIFEYPNKKSVPMQQMLRKARVLLTVWFAHMSAYRAEIVIWILTGSVPLIMLAVWIGKAQAGGGAVGGFTPQDFAAYFLAAWISQQLIVAWV